MKSRMRRMPKKPQGNHGQHENWKTENSSAELNWIRSLKSNFSSSRPVQFCAHDYYWKLCDFFQLPLVLEFNFQFPFLFQTFAKFSDVFRYRIDKYKVYRFFNFLSQFLIQIAKVPPEANKQLKLNYPFSASFVWLSRKKTFFRVLHVSTLNN